MQAPLQHRKKFYIGYFKPKELDIRIRLDQGAYVPGQIMRYEIELSGNYALAALQVKFIQFYAFSSKKTDNNPSKKKKVLIQQYRQVNQRSMIADSLPIPDKLLPSSLEDCIVHMHYYMQVTFYNTGLLKNKKLDIPITIGTVALKK